MIGFLRGQLMQVATDTILLDVQGVGYELVCSQNTLVDIQRQKDVSVWVYTHVREDALLLFGFSTKTEKQLFLSLIKVNNVGPRSAITILSGTTLGRLVEMIESSDVKGLSHLPKVGKKTAEQIILTLKGKLILADEEHANSKISDQRKHIVSALVNLGFRMNDVEQVVKGLPSDISVEDGVRRGLGLLANGQ